MKYFINPRKANESAIIERSIKRREKRKFIAKIVNSRVCDAVEVLISTFINFDNNNTNHPNIISVGGKVLFMTIMPKEVGCVYLPLLKV